jgi:hypothetical protein
MAEFGGYRLQRAVAFANWQDADKQSTVAPLLIGSTRLMLPPAAGGLFL